MKTRLAILLTLPALAVATPSFGQVSISGGVQFNVPAPSVQVSTPGFGLQINAVGDFYQPLTPYGTWMDYQGYGQCWHPTQVAGDWQPYTDGSWEYSDAGWYFNSEEPWGWATCHYGSWTFDPSIGWLWIPGTQWAPAWVTWRTSDDYIGWAPCGPSMSVLAPSLFVFVGVHNFGGTFTPGSSVFIRNNHTIINNTRVINNFNRRSVNFDGHQKTIFANTGPNVEHIQRSTGRQFTPRPVTDVVRQSKSRAPENLRGNQNPPNQNRQPQEQRYNNQQQRPNENYNRGTTPPPTGREQQRNYNNEQQNRLNQEQQQRNNIQNQNRLNQEQQRNNLENQNRMNQQQRQEQQRPEAMPPTGREQQRNYNNEQQNRLNQEQQRQQHSMPQTAPSERNLPPTGREVTPPSQQQEVRPPNRATPAQPATPAERAVPRQQPATPAERATPAQPATPPERNMAPTGRENAPSSQRQQEARPSQPPEQRGPAQAPGQQKKDNRDQ